jgi:DNA-binding NtrC family response regulator
LFLDEIGELPLELQPKLLRAIEYGEIRRLKGTSTVRVDVRVVAATRRDLLAEAQAGRFGEDLYERLAVFPLQVPPLRERGDDLRQLVLHLLQERCAGGQVPELTAAAWRAVESYGWPRNVRELRNAMARGLMRRKGPRAPIDVEDLALPKESGRKAGRSAGQGASAGPGKFGGDAFKAERRKAALRAVAECATQEEAAERLGISLRTLQRVLRERQGQ